MTPISSSTIPKGIEAPRCDHRGGDGSYYGASKPLKREDYDYNFCPRCGISFSDKGIVTETSESGTRGYVKGWGECTILARYEKFAWVMFDDEDFKAPSTVDIDRLEVLNTEEGR